MICKQPAYRYICCSNAAISNHHFEYFLVISLCIYIICNEIEREDWTASTIFDAIKIIVSMVHGAIALLCTVFLIVHVCLITSSRLTVISFVLTYCKQNI